MILHEGKHFDLQIGEVHEAKVIKWLGSGGFANVWLVEDSDGVEQFVLKHIQVKPEVSDKEKFIQRIENEASVDIPSKYVVKILGIREFAKDNYGILFEYIPGSSLSDWIKDNKSAPWERKRSLYIKILQGVSDAHRLNIIHRDLKPDNILVTDEDEPKIIDFGLAKFKDKSVTVTGDFGGTLPYADPEALLHGIKYVDCRCDIYALGVILYELIMGANFWILNDIEFGEFVGHLKAGKSNVLDIVEGFSFPEDDRVESALISCTMFNSDKRADSLDTVLSLLGVESSAGPSYDIDFEISSPVLIIEDGSAKGAINMITIPDGGQKTLGRLNLDATNNTISKEHAVVTRTGNQYYLYDSDSRNGTFLNGKKISANQGTAVEIKHTDRIRFADLWTRFVFLKK